MLPNSNSSTSPNIVSGIRTQTRKAINRMGAHFLDGTSAAGGAVIVLLLAFAAIEGAINDNQTLTTGLSPSAPEVNDGACRFPESLPSADVTVMDILKVYNPLRKYFIPRGSRAFYRVLYQVIHGGQAATSEDELAALRPRVQFLTLRVLRKLGNLEISFEQEGEDPDSKLSTWYGYRCFPSTFSIATPTNPFIPLMNVTCTFVGGESDSGIMSPEEIGTVYLAFLWGDDTSMSVWGCFHDEQNWHIMSTKPELTQEQIATNDDLLRAYGFNVSHAMNLTYDVNR